MTASPLPGLEIVWRPSTDEKGIDRQLKALDERLFLDKEWDRRFGTTFYVAKQYVGSEHPPAVVHEWRDPDSGHPLPLSSGLVYEVESRKRFFGRDLAREAEQANEALLRRKAEESFAEYVETRNEIIPKPVSVDELRERESKLQGLLRRKRPRLR